MVTWPFHFARATQVPFGQVDVRPNAMVSPHRNPASPPSNWADARVLSSAAALIRVAI
jgi:hypothetical protein